MNKNLFIFIFIFIFSIFTVETAEIPRLIGPVVDIANVLSHDEEVQLSSAISNYYSKTGIQFQILTIHSLDGENIDEFSIRLAEEWRIGSKSSSGVIITSSIKDRKIRIEVGGGLEGELTDALSSRIISQLMAPQFRKGNFALGFASALSVMSKKLGDPIEFSDSKFNQAYDYHSNSKKQGFSIFWIILIFFLLRGLIYGRGGGCLTGFLLGSLLGGSGRSRSTFGGGFSGGSWSGGGGGFSGGGASGGW